MLIFPKFWAAFNIKGLHALGVLCNFKENFSTQSTSELNNCFAVKIAIQMFTDIHMKKVEFLFLFLKQKRIWWYKTLRFLHMSFLNYTAFKFDWTKMPKQTNSSTAKVREIYCQYSNELEAKPTGDLSIAKY